MAIKTMREALGEAMSEEMRKDPKVFLMGEEVAEYDGAYKVSKGLLKEFGPKRVIDSPISEGGFAGLGVGAAMLGLKPIIEMMTWNFGIQAFDQIINHATKMCYMSAGQYPVPIVFRGPNGAAHMLSSQHSQNLDPLLANVPGLKLVSICTPADAKGLLKASIRDDDPVIFLEHKRTYRLVKGEVPEEEYTIPIGKADIKKSGDDLSIITYGLMVHHCLEAAQLAASKNISVEVLDLRTVRPLDVESIIGTVEKTGKVLIVYEDNQALGIGSEVSALISEHAFEYLDAPVVRLGGPEVPAMPFSPPLENMFMIDTEKISTAINKLAEY